jgi:hypothetical protein
MSTGLVPNAGEEQIIKGLLNVEPSENLVLRLFKNDITPTSTMTLTDYTEATFTGYSAVTLSSGSWNVSSSDTAYAEYAAGVPFTCTQTTSENVYGFYLTGAGSSALYWSERFDVAPRTITYVGDSLSPRPKITLAYSTGAAPSSLLTGLVSYWKLDEESGTRYDSVNYPSGNNLSDNNTVGYDTGINGNAASFVAGNNETLTVADGPIPEPAVTDVTWALWFRPTVNDLRYLFSKTAGSNDFTPYVYLNPAYLGGEVNVLIGNGSGTVNAGGTGVAGLLNNWNLMVLSWDLSEQTLSCYVNGNALAGTPATLGGTVSNNTGAFTLGGVPGGWFDGEIDEVAIWSRVLSEAERAELYAAGAGKFYPFTP